MLRSDYSCQPGSAHLDDVFSLQDFLQVKGTAGLHQQAAGVFLFEFLQECLQGAGNSGTCMFAPVLQHQLHQLLHESCAPFNQIVQPLHVDDQHLKSTK